MRRPYLSVAIPPYQEEQTLEHVTDAAVMRSPRSCSGKARARSGRRIGKWHVA